MKARIGRYYRDTSAARIDVIGQAKRVFDSVHGNFVELLVQNFYADGSSAVLTVRAENLEPSTKAAAAAYGR